MSVIMTKPGLPQRLEADGVLNTPRGQHIIQCQMCADAWPHDSCDEAKSLFDTSDADKLQEIKRLALQLSNDVRLDLQGRVQAGGGITATLLTMIREQRSEPSVEPEVWRGVSPPMGTHVGPILSVATDENGDAIENQHVVDTFKDCAHPHVEGCRCQICGKVLTVDECESARAYFEKHYPAPPPIERPATPDLFDEIAPYKPDPRD